MQLFFNLSVRADYAHDTFIFEVLLTPRLFVDTIPSRDVELVLHCQSLPYLLLDLSLQSFNLLLVPNGVDLEDFQAV